MIKWTEDFSCWYGDLEMSESQRFSNALKHIEREH